MEVTITHKANDAAAGDSFTQAHPPVELVMQAAEASARLISNSIALNNPGNPIFVRVKLGVEVDMRVPKTQFVQVDEDGGGGGEGGPQESPGSPQAPAGAGTV